MEKTEKKMGRPPGDPRKRRNKWLNVRFSDEDIEQLGAKAAKAGKGLTEWSRERLGLRP